jgi:SAM-dependent methyltransferase
MNETVSSGLLPPYTLAAALYDRMIGRFAFDQWRENFERLVKRYPLDLTACADVACGTGLASSYLSQRGASVTAVDISPDMLRAALIVTRGSKVKLLCQDMRHLYLPRNVNLIICATDSLNYLINAKDISRALRSFNSNLIPGGYVLFDMNTAWQLREGSDIEPWDFEVDGERMRWISEWDEQSLTASLRLIFLKTRGETGTPLSELHRERAYPPDWIGEELVKAGFEMLAKLDAAGLGRVGEKTRRIQYVARKTSRNVRKWHIESSC